MTTIEEWLLFFNDKERSKNLLENDYGADYHDIETKRKSIINLLNFHKNNYGNENIIIVRAPGRINLMGRHIDHQGGNVNLIAIDREIFLTASLRNDSRILSRNIEVQSFSLIDFDFSDIKPNVQDDWINIINNLDFIKKVRSPNGDWGNYFKAAYLRLVYFCKEKKVFGANFCVNGNIPIAAGLSSSSALTMGVFEALVNLNKIIIKDYDIINICAEAEWFVGTRGGASDHVAIKLGKKNKIAHVKFHDLEILEWAEFPKNWAIITCNTNVIADKSGNKKDQFNEKVLAYDIGFNLIKMKFPQYSKKFSYLRDVNIANLENSIVIFLKMLLEIPEYLEFEDLPKILGKVWEKLKKKIIFNNIPKKIAIRKVIAYGLSECERSISFFKHVKEKKSKLTGNLMNISHDGDRKVKFNSKLKEFAYDNELTDNYLKSLIKKNKKLLSNSLKLESLTGGYGCSIPEIDFIVDLAKSQKGVFGAQLSGAGLGGCAMILIEKAYSSMITTIIAEKYQEKFGKKCSIYLLKPVNGSSIYSNNYS